MAIHILQYSRHTPSETVAKCSERVLNNLRKSDPEAQLIVIPQDMSMLKNVPVTQIRKLRNQLNKLITQMEEVESRENN